MINMPIESALLPRERATRWDDPRICAEAGQTMNGRDFFLRRDFIPAKDDPLIR